MVDGNLYSLLNPVAAFSAGLVTSLHCVGMCGPLACTFIGGKKSAGAVGVTELLSYQLARLLTYSLVGGLAGALGAGFVQWAGATPAHLMPFALIIFFVAIVFGVEGLATKIPVLNRLSFRLMRLCYKVSGRTRGLALGMATPLLPCGPLYLAFWVACMSGSASQGALMLLFFGLGTLPALLATQLGWNWLGKRVGPARLLFWRRGLAGFAIVVLLGRVMIDLDFISVSAVDSVCFWK